MPSRSGRSAMKLIEDHSKEGLRHTPQPPTWSRDLAAMNEIDAHWHDGHQIAYASRGVLAVYTGTSRWIAPPHRAMWIPAGVVHAHRAYGATRLHLFAVPASLAGRPGSCSGDCKYGGATPHCEPAMFAVTPLLREALTRAHHGLCGPRRRPRERTRAKAAGTLGGRAPPQPPTANAASGSEGSTLDRTLRNVGGRPIRQSQFGGPGTPCGCQRSHFDAIVPGRHGNDISAVENSTPPVPRLAPSRRRPRSQERRAALRVRELQ